MSEEFQEELVALAEEAEGDLAVYDTILDGTTLVFVRQFRNRAHLKRSEGILVIRYDLQMYLRRNNVPSQLDQMCIRDRHKLHATFMPKPLFGEAGSGMHINMSLQKDGKNVFDDPSGENGLSKEAYGFIAGLMEHITGMTAVTNPLVNSYKRLVPGFEAPVYIAWSASNRSPLIRIPASRGIGTRIELRNPDPAANPYLVLALCLAAGLDGIERGLTPPPAIDGNIFLMSKKELEEKNVRSLPDSLKHAIRDMTQDQLVRDTLGEHIYNKYVEHKLHEWYENTTRVTPWELDRYLVRY